MLISNVSNQEREQETLLDGKISSKVNKGNMVA